MRRSVAFVVMTVLAAVGLAELAQPAFAHNTLTSSNPAKNAKVDQAPEQVTLTFNADVQSGPGNQIVVSGPDGKQYTEPSAEVAVDGTSARVDVPSLGPAGKYTIGYRILSADGHVVQNQLSFTLTTADAAAAPGSSEPGGQTSGGPAASGEPADDGGLPLWVWIAGAAVLLGAGLVFALRLGRELD
ncbi:MAG: copper resistance CopC family protein [Thermocrispum sp.]